MEESVSRERERSHLGCHAIAAIGGQANQRRIMIKNLKRRIFLIMEVTEPGDKISLRFDSFLVVLILLNVLAVMLETVDSIAAQYGKFLRKFDTLSVIVFTLEYLLRVWICTINPHFRSSLWGRIRYILTPLALIDLAAILPYFLPFLFPDLRFLRSARLFRLLRLLKLGRYSDSLRTFAHVIRAKKEDLMVSFLALSVLLVFASSLVYFAEHEAQPENFPSIPAAMWWGVVTLTTVGYGDIYPVTPLGKLLGAILAILGIGIFALPAGVLASGFSEEIERKRKHKRLKRRKKPRVCPHCGKRIEEVEVKD